MLLLLLVLLSMRFVATISTLLVACGYIAVRKMLTVFDPDRVASFVVFSVWINVLKYHT